MEQHSSGTDRIGTEKIGKLLLDFSIPAIIGMFVNTIYNVVDRIYVGQGVDPLGIAGVTVVMPAMLVIMSFSILIGVGANALFSIRLGEGRRDEVERIMGHAFLLLFILPGIFIIISLIFLDDILIRILGISEAVFPYAKSYFQVILYGGIFGAMSPGINHFIRSDGHPRISMFTQILGAGLNIILDPIFIFVFGWGVAGAAWATIISQFASFVWVMFYFNSKHTPLRFHIRDMKLDPGLTSRIIAIGFAPAAMTVAMSVVTVLQNRMLYRYGSDLAVAAMGIVFSIIMVVTTPLQGLTQGAQPIVGYNYGAKNFRRVRDTYKWTVISGSIFITAGFAVIQLFPQALIGIFTAEKGELLDLGVRCMRFSTMLFPLVGFQMISSNYFQSVGKPVQSTMLSLSRQIFLYIPLVLLLPRIWGIDGVFYALPVSDIGSAALTVAVMRHELKRLGGLVAEEG
ncbi:MAG: MATE family efflux transporter [Peptococcaceae bacterium]|nr:MATE family efflux transporter [Peptococcaceae bacterium]